LRRLGVEGLGQSKLHDYRGPGLAHHVIFWGFLVLLLRTVTLWGRAYDPGFQGFWFGPSSDDAWGLGNVYRALREYCALLVLVAVGYFAYLRLWRRERRLTLNREALVILALIATMMVADLTYDACGTLLAATPSIGLQGQSSNCTQQWVRDFLAPFVFEHGSPEFLAAPGSSVIALLLGNRSPEVLLGFGLLGYYLHVVLVLVFLTLLPVSKHFHILLALPNLFFGRVGKEGTLSPVASSVEALLAQVETAMEQGNLDEVPIGKARLEHFDRKQRLDWLTCTECGRCTEQCPANRTGKPLDPKGITLALREHLRAEGPRWFDKRGDTPEAIVPKVIDPAALWACTTCRACEEQCPVGISYLDSIVGMRRNLVMMRGEVPVALHRAFDGMERNYNPWNFPKGDRAAWTQGLEVPELKNEQSVEYLFWVGCAASYDERCKSVARAFVRLMHRAKVRFAILGAEERCTGDSARRAGNELLFLQLAEANIATLNTYLAEKRFVRIVTTCPHCYTTLKNDYPDFGGQFEVVHHSVALAQWVRDGRLGLRQPLDNVVAFHDPCTLARYAGITDEPRRLLKEVPGLELKEPAHHGRHTLCCGAGGGQMWLEEQNNERMNVHRSRELLQTNAERIVSACPFCLTMVSDGVKALDKGSEVVVEDLAEVLERAL
jgi:Fe-S oxidoreductase